MEKRRCVKPPRQVGMHEVFLWTCGTCVAHPLRTRYHVSGIWARLGTMVNR